MATQTVITVGIESCATISFSSRFEYFSNHCSGGGKIHSCLPLVGEQRSPPLT